MNKKSMLLGCIGISVAVSCALMRKSEDQDDAKGATAFSEKSLNEGKKESFRLPKQMPLPPQTNAASVQKPKPIAHYDSAALDERVIIEAKRMKKDPKNYRMLLRTDDDGARVYRTLGMHIIVSPLGEEAFLPDEI